MKYVLLLLAFALPCHAEGLNLDPWTREDSYRQAAVTVLLLADWQQTRYMARHRCSDYTANCRNDFGETGLFAKNVIGEQPSVGKVNNYFAATIVVSAAISYVLPREWREAWQYVWIGMEIGYVRTNYVGIKHGF